MSFRSLTALALIAALVPLVASAAPKPKTLPGPVPGTRLVALPPLPTPTEADWLTPDPNNLLVIDTNKGRILVELYPQLAPNHVAQVQTLARRHFYDGLSFFRVVEDFMDQTGDPKNTGEGGSDLPNLKAEFTFRRTPQTPFVTADASGSYVSGFIGVMPVMSQSEDLMAMTASGTVNGWGLFCPGVAGMARAGDPDSANSQFFLMRAAFPSLNQKYTAFGRVLAGMDAVKLIKVGEPVEAPQDKMLTVRLASDMPAADRPKIQVLNTSSVAFRAQLDRAITDNGSAFAICDVPIPTRAGLSAKP